MVKTKQNNKGLDTKFLSSLLISVRLVPAVCYNLEGRVVD